MGFSFPGKGMPNIRALTRLDCIRVNRRSLFVGLFGVLLRSPLIYGRIVERGVAQANIIEYTTRV